VGAHATTNSNREQNLVTQARNGDANAFAVLYEMHKPRIVAVCLRMTKDMAEAQDLTQDAFMYVFRKFSAFRGDSAFSTWLHRVAVNTVLMHFRKKSRRQVSLEQPHPQDSRGLRREYGRVDEELAWCADRIALTRAIAALSPGYRMIFLLHEMQGFDHHEIAQRLHCSIGNSKSQLHKAKLRIRESLARHGYTYRPRVAVMKPTAFHASFSTEAATMRSLVPSSIDVSTWPGSERKESVLGRVGKVASLVHEKQLSHREDLTDGLIDGDPEIIPAIEQGNPELMAERGA
jgi:RNA polymerase sigma-70 factor (ECF subfamily)